MPVVFSSCTFFLTMFACLLVLFVKYSLLPLPIPTLCSQYVQSLVVVGHVFSFCCYYTINYPYCPLSWIMIWFWCQNVYLWMRKDLRVDICSIAITVQLIVVTGSEFVNRNVYTGIYPNLSTSFIFELSNHHHLCAFRTICFYFLDLTSIDWNHK